MKLEALDYAIRAMCGEVANSNRQAIPWKDISEEELLYEMAVCVFSSQMVFEVATAAVDRLKQRRLLCVEGMPSDIYHYQSIVRQAFEEPLDVVVNSKRRKLFPRFRNRISALLARTVDNIYWDGGSIKEVLKGAHSARNARELLINAVSGFGPKQASLYLRRIGYSSDLAVLDTHVLDYMKLALGVKPKRSLLSNISGYESLETEFQEIAAKFGYTIGCVDLALWITMRVAKREYAL